MKNLKKLTSVRELNKEQFYVLAGLAINGTIRVPVMQIFKWRARAAAVSKKFGFRYATKSDRDNGFATITRIQ